MTTGEDDMGVAAVLEAPVSTGLTRKERKAAKRRLKAQIAPTRDNFVDRVVKENITTTTGLSEKDRERLLRLQRSTGVTEEVRQKLDFLGGLRIEHTPQHRPRANNLVQVPLDYYAMRNWVNERQYLAGSKFHELWYYGAVKLGFAQMKMNSLPGGTADPDFLRVSADRYQKAKLAIRGLLPALVSYNVCCLGEWASYLGPEELEGKKIKRHRLMDHLRSGLDDLAGQFRIDRKAL
jgi:hypothetical protein